MYAFIKDNLQISLIETSLEELNEMIKQTMINGMELVGYPVCYAKKDFEILLWPKPPEGYTIEEVK